LVIAPSIALDADAVSAYAETGNISSKEIKVTMESNDAGIFTATVTTVINNNGEESISEEVFEGTEAEVKANIDALKDKNIKAKVLVEKVIEEEVN